ncbi:signal peptide peptidase-domain-containing protein [Xylaria intraflava]|nr:signal peptide peptidase-domain-containing protein [Xylaria intraflava]
MAANNSTFLPLDEVSLDNITTVVASNQTLYEKLASIPTVLLLHTDLLALESRIVFASLACIYISSHGALRRPPSAKAPKKDKSEDGKKGAVTAGESQERDDNYVQGLLPSDAVAFPIIACFILVGLYYLIKWLGDSDILNTILRLYFSAMSLASLKKLVSDGLQLLIGFAFPTVWINTNGTLYHIDSKRRGQWHTKNDREDKVWDDKKRSPMPGLLSKVKFPDRINALLWEIRHHVLENWTIRFVLHGIIDEKTQVTFSDFCGAAIAVGVIFFYHANASTPISNFMGYAFSYTSINMISPTTFTTGSLFLFGLFLYDIVMVFYTPYMVTVATKIDAPIKLVFEGPERASMLGLGDIVIPGMFIALCLRFDHYMYYYRQRKLKEVELQTDDMSSGQLVTTKKSQRMVVKPEYVNPTGQWGDRYWATKLSKVFSPDATPSLKASAFPRPYFYAAIAGYLLAMIVTLVMLLTFQHAQPALLYLVPGVVIAVWATGAVRGEIREMYEYTEDGSLDKTDVIVEVDQEGNVVKEIQEDKDKGEQSSKQKEDEKKNSADEKTKGDTSGDEELTDEKGSEAKETRHAFLLSVELPGYDQ